VVTDSISHVQCLTSLAFEHIFETEIRTRPSRPRVGSELSTKEEHHEHHDITSHYPPRTHRPRACTCASRDGAVFLTSPGALAENEVAANDFDYMTVLSGDTLWSIATMIAPEEDPRDVVADIISLNQLPTAALTPGQEIALPR